MTFIDFFIFQCVFALACATWSALFLLKVHQERIEGVEYDVTALLFYLGGLIPLLGIAIAWFLFQSMPAFSVVRYPNVNFTKLKLARRWATWNFGIIFSVVVIQAVLFLM